MSVRCTILALATALVLPTIGGAAEPIKPGSPEWERRFAEHRQRFEQQKRSVSSNGRSSASFERTRRSNPQIQKDLKTRLERSKSEREEKLKATMDSFQRRIYEGAKNPQPFNKAKSPSAERCLLALRDVLRKETDFRKVVLGLAASKRVDYIKARVHPSMEWMDKTDAEHLAQYRGVVGYVTEVETVAAVSGQSDMVNVWAWVEAPNLSRALYKFTMIGEGPIYRLAGYEADLIQF